MEVKLYGFCDLDVDGGQSRFVSLAPKKEPWFQMDERSKGIESLSLSALFIRDLFNDTFSISDYTALNCGIINER
jgi:hypothetical protein